MLDDDGLLDQLFLDPPLWNELAPSDWTNSPFVRFFHPTLPQALEETIRMTQSLSGFRREPETPEEAASRVASAVESTIADYRDGAAQAGEEEPATLVGWCVWDLFAEHIVLRPNGQEVDLGSWRGAGGVVADWLSRHTQATYDYMDFYMGSSMVSHRADIRPVYVLIFRRLRAHGFDWVYEFPRLNLVNLSGSEPDESFLKMKVDLDLADQKARREARTSEPPAVVAAYREVFGRFPRGWPPS